ncbi:MAG: glycosyltransferase family 4 protein, partial [Acidimicrobiales bacterium]
LAPGVGEVVFNGVRIDETAPEAMPLPFDRYVLALGRAVEKKGFDLLLRAFARLEGHDEVGLVIGGDGSALARLGSLAREVGLGTRVTLPGRLNRGQVAGLMQRAEVFVMPSRLEPFGIVVLEAWRAGLPVIATSRGGPPEFVENGVDGLLVDPFDERAVTGCLDRLLSDRELGRILGSAGRNKVQRFQWSAIAQQYRDLYGKAIDSR